MRTLPSSSLLAQCRRQRKHARAPTHLHAGPLPTSTPSDRPRRTTSPVQSSPAASIVMAAALSATAPCSAAEPSAAHPPLAHFIIFIPALHQVLLRNWAASSASAGLNQQTSTCLRACMPQGNGCERRGCVCWVADAQLIPSAAVSCPCIIIIMDAHHPVSWAHVCVCAMCCVQVSA